VRVIRILITFEKNKKSIFLIRRKILDFRFTYKKISKEGQKPFWIWYWWDTGHIPALEICLEPVFDRF